MAKLVSWSFRTASNKRLQFKLGRLQFLFYKNTEKEPENANLGIGL